MKNRVLYFPYIQIPESPWLTQMLLYWDQVASIVPYDFIAEPEALGPYMRSLVTEELVLQVSPEAYIPDVPRFTESFQRYLNGLVDIGARRQRFDQKDTIRIHMEKVGPIGDRLKDEGLARLERYPWYDVESQTADDFMAYLATVLGQIPEIASTPVTDQDQSLEALVSAGVAPLDVEVQLDTLRLRILDRVLPTPDHAVNAEELRRFRDQHGDALPDMP